ncbi:MAG: hypothetical protein Q9208_003397 [Pyrenodesmia sp. 3 TL-2023]
MSIVLAVLLISSVLALPVPAHVGRRDNSKNAVSCISCHGTAGLADPSGWSRDRDFEWGSPISRRNTGKRAAKPGSDWSVSPADDDASLEGRGTAWDNAPSEGKRDTLDASMRRRGSLQDSYDTGLSGLRARGTNWDGTHGEDRRDALGPKVGQGGKPKPHDSNGWELGRLARRYLDVEPSMSASRDALARRKAAAKGDAGTVDGKPVPPVFSISPSSSWKGQNRREARPHAGEMAFGRRTEDEQGDKPTPAGANFRPAGACVSCMVKRWVKRWVWVPDGSSTESTDSSVNTAVRAKRTEDGKGGPVDDKTEPVPAGGVPMPLSFGHSAQRVKRCVSQAKESGWNHKCW